MSLEDYLAAKTRDRHHLQDDGPVLISPHRKRTMVGEFDEDNCDPVAEFDMEPVYNNNTNHTKNHHYEDAYPSTVQDNQSRRNSRHYHSRSVISAGKQSRASVANLQHVLAPFEQGVENFHLSPSPMGGMTSMMADELEFDQEPIDQQLEDDFVVRPS